MSVLLFVQCGFTTSLNFAQLDPWRVTFVVKEPSLGRACKWNSSLFGAIKWQTEWPIWPQRRCLQKRAFPTDRCHIPLQVVHGDLASRNVLLDAYLVAKVSDFGLSRNLYNYNNYVKKGRVIQFLNPKHSTKMYHVSGTNAVEMDEHRGFAGHDVFLCFGRMVVWGHSVRSVLPWMDSLPWNELHFGFHSSADRWPSATRKAQACGWLHVRQSIIVGNSWIDSGFTRYHSVIQPCWNEYALDRPTFADILNILRPEVESASSAVSDFLFG